MRSPSRHQARRQRVRRGPRRNLRLETLEERRLLAVLTVDTDLDLVDADDGMTSLREAIAMANDLAGADEIVFDFGHDGPATIRLEQGELQLTEALTIIGAGSELLTIDAQQQSRIFNITAADGDFTIEGLTLTNGKTAGSNEGGGAIRSMTRDALTVHNCVVKDSVATSSGGGIEVVAEGNLTVNSSTISGNSAASGGGISAHNVTVNFSTVSGNSGGGVHAHNALVNSSTISGNSSGSGISAYNATVNSSTISGNSSASGGGISAYAVGVKSSTISGNSATGRGGGISASSSVRVNSSTIFGNRASYGGGISGEGGFWGWPRTDLSNSIVAGNRDDGQNPDAVRISTIQHSLVGDGRGTGLPEAAVGSPDANGNLIGGPVGGAIDPRLGPLSDNGGPTFTHALLSGSPAIDAGDPSAAAGSDDLPLHDQRGEPRTVDGNADGVSLIDMGAVERQSKSLSATIVSVSSPTVTAVDGVTIQFTSPVSGFDVGDFRLSLNGGENLLTGDEALVSSDNQTFGLSGLADVTAVAGYYTLSVIPSGSDIMALDGGQFDSEVSTSWAMGRSTLGLTVDTLIDEEDGRIDDGDVSLRDAIAAAAPGETINFDASLDAGTIRLTLGELPITRSLTVDATELATGLVIDAAGSDVTPMAADGRGSRIFDIDDDNPYDDSPVTIRSVTLTGGDVHAEGGAIRSQETLSIESTSILSNSAGSEGGGIWAVGDVTITSSTIASNEGGGIRAFGNVAVTSSTISQNDAARDGGGGIWAFNVTVRSSTVFGNSGQGIFASQNAIIESSIVAGNIDADNRTIIGGVFIRTGADLSRGNGTLTVQHSLIGDNRGTDLPEAPFGSPDANGNLIGGPGGGVIDPRLGPLADNGGPTLTHALLPGSPAIDAGDPVAVTGGDGVPIHDQRGELYAVMVDGNGDGVPRIDMGALERQSESLTATMVSVSSPTATPVDAITIQFSRAVSGFDVGDLKLSLNGREKLLTGAETLSTADSQTFVLGGMADATSSSGYYTLMLTVFGSEIMASDGSPLDAGARISWAIGRSTLGLTVDTLVDEADGRIDDGDVSLRDAIPAAAPGETINFEPSLDGGTILLTLGELSLPQSLTVDATELANGLIIDAAGNDASPNEDDGRGSRIFEIDDGNPFADSPVSIRGLTLTGADSHAVGGAIFSRETLSIESTSVIENSAGSDGGGIWSVADVTISSSTISENSAAGGNRRVGSVTSFGNVTVNSSTVSDNTGRGIHALRDVTVNSSTISRNSGGGIQGDNVTVSSSTIADNTASEGGGLSAGNVTVSSSTISGNSASRGGGIHGEYSVEVNSSTIADNTASEGGGIHSRNDVTVISSTISGNSARSFGGGIRGGNVTVESSTISDNTASGNAGGGISGDNVMVRSSTISGNTTPHGGGISGAHVSVDSSTISGNIAIFSGGGIWAEDDVMLNSSTISGNTTVFNGDRPPTGNLRLSVGGGGIHSLGGVTIVNSILAGNHGTTPDLKRGFSSFFLTIQNSLIGDNRGAGVGEAPVGLFDADSNVILIGGPVNGAIDPLLGPLADNGGPTFTHALLPGSPAIDAGDPRAVAGSDDVPRFDQRGAPYSRVVGGRIDMGAFEWSAPDHINDRLIGDSNDDGVFDDLDLVQVLSAGKYKDDIANNATFDEGDWNGDGDFDSLDLVFALQAGHYASQHSFD